MGDSQSIPRRGAYVSCRGCAGIPQAHGIKTMNQGGTADKRLYSSLTEQEVCQGRFLLRLTHWREAPSASPGGKLSSEARLMRNAGGNVS